MECSFEDRKRELESECKVSSHTLASAASRLDSFMKPYLVSYRRHEQATNATTVARGLCSDLEHKNGESIAYLFCLDRKVIQHFIGESTWSDQPLRKELAAQIGSQLGEPDGVIAFDPSAFPKFGKQSVAVARQWCGRLGKIDNCQVAVYMGYVSSQGHALVDTELYLPKEWTSDKKRMKRAGVPKDRQGYHTRHKLCLELLERHGDQLPHTWITGDDETGQRSRVTAAEEVLVVIRYRDRDSAVVKTDYYLSNAEAETSLAEFCRAAKAGHRIEECLQRAKSQAGLADYEVRNWLGCHNHQTLSLLASWFLNIATRRAEKKDTGNHFQPSSTWDRFHPSHRTPMRYTVHRQMANRATSAA